MLTLRLRRSRKRLSSMFDHVTQKGIKQLAQGHTVEMETDGDRIQAEPVSFMLVLSTVLHDIT